MKKFILFVLVAGLVFSANTFDQNAEKVKKGSEVKVSKNNQIQKRSAEERATILTDKLTKELTLNNDQNIKIYQINLTATKEIDFLRENRETKARTFKSEIKAAYDKRDSAIRALLNPTQLKMYEENKSMWREKRNSK